MIPTYRKNFETLLLRAQDGNLALLECTDAQPGEPRYVPTSIGQSDGLYERTPLGHLADGAP